MRANHGKRKNQITIKDLKRLPLKLRHQVKALLDGTVGDHKENILAFIDKNFVFELLTTSPYFHSISAH